MAFSGQINLTAVTLDRTIADLGGRTFTVAGSPHALIGEYKIEELRYSADLQSAVDAGEVTLTDQDGDAIPDLFEAGISHKTRNVTTNTGLNAVNVSSQDVRIDLAFDDLPIAEDVSTSTSFLPFYNGQTGTHQRGKFSDLGESLFTFSISGSFTATAPKNGDFFKLAGGVDSSLSPIVLPYDYTLVAMSAGNQLGSVATFTMTVYKYSPPSYSGTATSATITLDEDFAKHQTGYVINFSAGDRIGLEISDIPGGGDPGSPPSRPEGTIWFVRRYVDPTESSSSTSSESIGNTSSSSSSLRNSSSSSS